MPPTETIAVGVRDHKAVPEACVSTDLYNDGDYTITRSGDAVFCKKDKKTSRIELPASESYADADVITFHDNHYLALYGSNDKVALACIESGGRFESVTSNLESDGREFYYFPKYSVSLVMKDSQILTLCYKKFDEIELKNGTIMISYYPQDASKDGQTMSQIEICDRETLGPLDENLHWFKNCLVKNEVAVFFTPFNDIVTSDGKEILKGSYKVVWSNEKYQLISRDYRYLMLCDNQLNLLCDYGFVNAGNKYDVKTDGDGLKISAKIHISFEDVGIELHYPQADLNAGEIFYKDGDFELRRADSGWFAKLPKRNYLIPVAANPAESPVYGKDATENREQLMFLWPDTGESFCVEYDDGVPNVGYYLEFNNSFEWNGCTVLSDGWSNGFVLDKDKNVLLYTSFGALFDYGSLLECYFTPDGGEMEKIFYKQDLTPITKDPLIIPSHTKDGGVIGIIDKHFEVFDSGGNSVRKSRDYDRVFNTVCDESVTNYGAFVLVYDGGKLKLLDENENVAAEFEGYSEKFIFHWMLCGYFKKTGAADAPPAYYFVFEDQSDISGGENTVASIEYWYAPETGKSGVIKSHAYGDFTYAKPVLYLYPEKETNVSIKFAHPERLTTVYPEYNDGWSVKASPDGNLFDGKRNYYALYWEENSDFVPDFSTGFIVEDNYSEFLEEKLNEIGLSEREANEFIMYWLPILEKNGKSIVHFELTESREAGNKLLISPEPDSLLRIAIHIKKAGSVGSVTPQTFAKFERKGFTAVEWGGRVYE